MVSNNKEQRDRSKKRRAVKCEPQPCWVQAFMIKMLHKLGGSETLSIADLKRFEVLKSDNKTLFSFDVVAETVTITAPEMTLPEKPSIVHNKRILTPN